MDLELLLLVSGLTLCCFSKCVVLLLLLLLYLLPVACCRLPLIYLAPFALLFTTLRFSVFPPEPGPRRRREECAAPSLPHSNQNHNSVAGMSSRIQNTESVLLDQTMAVCASCHRASVGTICKCTEGNS